VLNAVGMINVVRQSTSVRLGAGWCTIVFRWSRWRDRAR
jgi:hypothetical protein